MNRIVGNAIIILFCSGLWASCVSAGDVILPHGDPRLQEPSQAEQELITESLKKGLS